MHQADSWKGRTRELGILRIRVVSLSNTGSWQRAKPVSVGSQPYLFRFGSSPRPVSLLSDLRSSSAIINSTMSSRPPSTPPNFPRDSPHSSRSTATLQHSSSSSDASPSPAAGLQAPPSGSGVAAVASMQAQAATTKQGDSSAGSKSSKSFRGGKQHKEGWKK